MLAKDDLFQIREIIRDETRKIVREELKVEIDPLKQDVKELKSEVKVLRKDVTKIREDTNTIVNYFDREYLELRNRVENIEQHLGITYTS